MVRRRYQQMEHKIGPPDFACHPLRPDQIEAILHRTGADGNGNAHAGVFQSQSRHLGAVPATSDEGARFKTRLSVAGLSDAERKGDATLVRVTAVKKTNPIFEGVSWGNGRAASTLTLYPVGEFNSTGETGETTDAQAPIDAVSLTMEAASADHVVNDQSITWDVSQADVARWDQNLRQENTADPIVHAFDYQDVGGMGPAHMLC